MFWMKVLLYELFGKIKNQLPMTGIRYDYIRTDMQFTIPGFQKYHESKY